MHSESSGSAWSWRVSELPGLECFQASAIRHQYGRHSHSEWAIGIIEEGVGGTVYRGVRENISPGEIVVINPEEVHTGYPADGRSLTYRMFYVSPSFFRDIVGMGLAFPRFANIRIRDAHWAVRLRQIHQGLCGEVGLSSETAIIETLREFVAMHTDVALRTPKGAEPVAVRK